MSRGRVLLFLGFALVLGLAAWAQSSGLEALIQAIQRLLGEKQGELAFFNLTLPERKTVETIAPQEFAKPEEVVLPSPALLLTIEAALPEKPVTFEQAFLLPPKEPGPVGNEFQEEIEG